MRVNLPNTPGFNNNDATLLATIVAAPTDKVILITARGTFLCTVSQLVSSAGTTVFPTGVGSPEGAVTADVGTPYIDTDADALWYKKTGSGNTGWQQLLA